MDKEYQRRWTRTNTRESGQGRVPEKVDKDEYLRRWTRTSTRQGGQGHTVEKKECAGHIQTTGSRLKGWKKNKGTESCKMGNVTGDNKD